MAIIVENKPHATRLLALRVAVKPTDLPQDYAPAFTERATTVEKDLEHFLTKADETMQARTLTREGQLQEMSRLSSTQFGEIQKTHASIRTKLTEQIDTARADALKRPASKDDPSVRYLRQMDAIEYFAELDPMKQRVAVQDALREKDVEFIDALLTAPRYRKTYDTAPLLEARDALAAEANPQIAKLSALRDSYDRVYQTAATIIKQTAEQAGVRIG